MLNEDFFASLRDRLEKAGLDPTLKRILVLSVLMENEHPLNAKEVYENLCGDNRLNRTTVYRILDLFAEKGLASKISSGERSFCYCARPDRRANSHCHFHCKLCGRIECLQDLPGLNESELKSGPGMDIHNIELRLDGICRTCKGN
jgi:Fe2+ or Zn2+ uptake regulation protein